MFALLVLSMTAAYSQAVNGTMLGTVTDASGAVVVNAKVTITETNTGISHSAMSNESGNYSFGDLPPGRYAVVVEQTGFKRENRRDIDLQVDSTVRVNVSLQPGAVTETVEVTGAPPILQTDTASTGDKMDQIQTANLPLIAANRNFQSLLNMVPGVAPVAEQHSQFFNASSSLQTEVNGQMREGNNFMIEGTDDNERTGLLQIYIPPIEAIQTVDISLTDHDPEMGRATGAVVNVLLKSGSNAIHGSVYEFLQNSEFDARSFFNPSLGHLAYNYVGGTIGGPIKKNKIFFFGDFLSVRDHEAASSNVTIIPSQWRGGNLSTSSQTIYDPNTGNPLDGTGRTPFPGNVIPTNRINPVSAAILNLFPGTNEAYNIAAITNNYFASLPYQKTTDSFDIKIDDNFTDKDRLTGRFSYAKPVVFQAPLFGQIGGDGPGGAFMGTGVQKTYSTGLNYDHIFSPTLLAEARVGVSYYNNIAQQSDYGTNDTTAIGIPGVNINPFTTGFVGINLGDGISQPMTGYSASLPWVRSEANIDIVNTWTKTLKNHSIKFGFDLKRIRDSLLQDQTYSPRGIITFGNEQTALCTPLVGTTSCATPKVGVGDDVAAFLLDVPSQLGRDVNTYFPGLRAWEFFAFVGDKWQVSQKLTVDLGLRWEFYPPATPAFANAFSNYDPNNNTLVVTGTGGNPTNLGMVTRYKEWAPRLGIAYRLDDKTVIRAGFGISYTPFGDNNYAYNYPVRANNFYTNVGDGYAETLLPSGQPASFQNGFPLPQPVTIPSNGIINAGANSTLLSQSEYIVNQNFKNASVITWNIAVQRTLPMKLTLDLAYVGLKGVDTQYSYNMNQSTSVLGTGTAGEPLNAAFGKTASATVIWAGASSTYNGLQVKLDRRSPTFNLTTSFSYQRAMDFQQDDDGAPLWLIGFNRNYARADFDRHYAYVQSYVYSLPYGPGRSQLHGPINYLVGGWQISGILTLESGSPIEDVGASGSSLNTPGETQTANQVAPVSYPKGINVGNPWFSTASFTQPTGVAFGTSGRNLFSGPGLFILNASLFKNIRVRERFNIEVRGEAFNITNTPEFSNPSASITSSTYGYVTGTLGSGTGVNGTGGGRALQLGVKVSF